MDRRRFQALREILSRALALGGEERVHYLDGACGEDRALRIEVERVLAEEDELDDFLETPPMLSAPLAGEDDERVGHRIGGYVIERVISAGGMGIVYEARQEHPERLVALKVMKHGFPSPSTLRRFEHEAEILARLRHPNVAQVYEAGTHVERPGGPDLPYFAMEYVPDARTICEHAREEGLSIEERLALFRHVCDAVHHGHQRGIIHRDLKPGNILVDGEGTVKIIDFGVARVTDSDLGSTTVLTEVGQLIGTLQYMSPEQLAVDSSEVDTRSDVYALGVVLYELLCDELPYDVHRAALFEATRRIQEEPPRRPSTVNRRLRGDLETIVLKTLEKAPPRRYQTVSELGADIERFLGGEVILACRANALVRAWKEVRRHPLPSAVAAVVLLWGIGFLAYDGVYSRPRLREKASEAERRRADVERLSVAKDLEDLLARADLAWPPEPARVEEYEGWIERAKELRGQLPLLHARRDELRREALPRTEEERSADRESHVEYAELAPLRAKLAARKKALAVRRGEATVERPSVDWTWCSREPLGVVKAGWALVNEERELLGLEELGLAVLEKAAEARDDPNRPLILDSLARARLTVGLDELALEASRAAAEAAQGGPYGPAYSRTLRELESFVAARGSEAGLQEAGAEVSALEHELARLEDRLNERRTWSFSRHDVESRWWNGQLTALIDALESLDDPEFGLLSEKGVDPGHGWSVPLRLALARELRAGFAPGGTYASRWREARPLIEAAYPGLELPVQTGLVPLGRDRASGLWEFWHVPSGEEPARAESGELVLTEEGGIVLVLLPAGEFWMGAQGEDPSGPNHDPHAQPTEQPVHEVELSAFFLSKYEVTQAQWMRLCGENPSEYQLVPVSPTLLHPVERISWKECMVLLSRFGLTLPSEAQWEYGARAGTDTPWWTGGDRESLRVEHAFNIADLAAARAGARFDELSDWPDLDDGSILHAEIGSYSANPFGLHEIHGDLFELCLDGFQEGYSCEVEPLDPVCPPESSLARPVRGGCFTSKAVDTRCAARAPVQPSTSSASIGVRPARPVRPR